LVLHHPYRNISYPSNHSKYWNTLSK
jgi:hypothetical protein